MDGCFNKISAVACPALGRERQPEGWKTSLELKIILINWKNDLEAGEGGKE